jgi:4-diphosphocytidyl-2-C-methyl-D-erythritol kinase
MLRFPNAKINLGLNIVSRRADGYHDIETVFYPIGLRDVLEIVKGKHNDATLTTYGRAIDCPTEKNLVMKAYRAMQKEYGLPPVDIFLQKNIPDGAGLGGGSADASTALLILNELFNIGASNEHLAKIAAKLGADCPFFIYNRPMLATGIGDILSDTEVSLKGKSLLLVKPSVSVPTAVAYSHVTPHKSDADLQETLKLDVTEWEGLLKNDFEPSVFAEYPELGQLKEKIKNCGAVYASMSGSGSSIFGIFESANMSAEAKEKIGIADSYVINL